MRRCSDMPANLGGIGLDDVECAALQPWQKALAARQHFAAGDGHRALTPQLAEIIDSVGTQRFLEPADVIVGKHMSRVDGPAQTVRPIGVAGSGIDEELAAIADRFALAALTIASSSLSSRRCRPNGPQPILNALKPFLDKRRERLRHAFGFFHEQRAIGPDARAIDAAEQAR